MLELDITHMVEKDGDEMPLLSGSVAELGPNAGILTWENSKRYAEAHPLLNTPEQIEEAKDYFKGFGAGLERRSPVGLTPKYRPWSCSTSLRVFARWNTSIPTRRSREPLSKAP